MNMGRKVTIKEVAKEAGVAISTVSNALNGSSLVTESTRKRVIDAVEKLGYVPNVNGRILKKGRSRQLCFITSSITGEYFSRLLDAANDACVKNEYGLSIIVTKEQSMMMQHLLGRQFDGFFLFEGERIQAAEMEIIKNERLVTMFLDRSCRGQRIGSVIFDSRQVGYEITKYLINLGHKRFCFVDTADDVYDAVERKSGYLEALREYGIEEKDSKIIQGYFDEHITFSAVLALEARNRLEKCGMPTAFVCGNDQSAVGAVKALRNLGYRIPEEISVVGFDDIELAQYFDPPLTTVRNPIEKQARTAVEMMVDMLEKEAEGNQIVLEGNLIVRKSAGICAVQER